MKLRHGLAFALLLPLAGAAGLCGLAGCGGSPSPSPRAVRDADKAAKERDKGTAARPEEKPKGKPADQGTAARPPDGGKKPPPRANPSVEPVKGGDGVIRGAVTWEGEVPPDGGTAPAADRAVLRGGKKVHVTPTPRVVVDPKSKGLANVVAWLVKPPAGAAPFPPEGVALKQSLGNFEPHLAFAGVRSELRLRTADDTASFELSGANSLSRTLRPGEEARVRLRPGLVVVRSGDHPWMTPACVHVLDHTFSAVSAADGSFTLPKVPPGEYEVWLWHEGWVSSDPGHPGEREAVRVKVPVKVGEGDGAVIRWALSQAR
jgi:hypothetical protein